jgi:hypothetical protein
MPVFPGFQALFGFFDYKRKDARGGGGLAAGLAFFMFLRAASGMGDGQRAHITSVLCDGLF